MQILAARSAAAKRGAGIDRAGPCSTLRAVAHAAPLQSGETVIPWLDQRADNPVPQVIANQLHWEQLTSWITPNDQFFSVAHYNRPEIDAATPGNWRSQGW